MNETIRDYVKRLQRWSAAIWIIGLALVFLPRALNKREGLYVGMRLAGFLVLALGPTLMARVKCPKCSRPLGRVVMWRGGKADSCPNCGVSFDEPLPHNPIS